MPPPPTASRRVPVLAATGIALGASLASCLFGAMIGATANGTTATKTVVSYAPSPYPVVSTVTETKIVTVEVTPTQAPPPPAPPAPAGPKTTFDGDGTFLIGTDIQSGTYRAKVPVSSVGCYWQRMKGTSGGFDDIIANDNVSPGAPAVVTIGRSDKAFQTNRCGTWEKIK
jgi:hypothetical protein